MYDSAKSVLEYYGKQRTQNAKGVTIPSQKRYINYYDVSLRNKLTYSSVKMYLRTGKNIDFQKVCLLKIGSRSGH